MDLVSFTYSRPWYICIQPCFIFYLDCRFFSICLFLTRIIVHLQRFSRDIYLSLKIALLFAFEESLVSFFCSSYVSFRNETVWRPEGRGGGGREILNKVLYGKAQPWGPPRYPFIYHFWLKRYPFRISSIDKWYFFNIPIVEPCIFLNCCKRTFKISINHNTRTFFRLFSQP